MQLIINETTIATPFHDQIAPNFLKQKYLQIATAFESTEFSIVKVQSCNYLEKYTIKTPSGEYLYNGYYKKNYVFNFHSTSTCPEDDTLLAILNNPNLQNNTTNTQMTKFEYTPSQSFLKELCCKIETLCESVDIQIVNIVEYVKDYKVRYSFQTEKNKFYIDFFFNKKAYITYATINSWLGENDADLQQFIKLFNN